MWGHGKGLDGVPSLVRPLVTGRRSTPGSLWDMVGDLQWMPHSVESPGPVLGSADAREQGPLLWLWPHHSHHVTCRWVEGSTAEKAQKWGPGAPGPEGMLEKRPQQEKVARALPAGPGAGQETRHQGFAAQRAAPGPGRQLELWWPSLYMVAGAFP